MACGRAGKAVSKLGLCRSGCSVDWRKQESRRPGAILDAVDSESHGVSGSSQLIERGRQVAEKLGSQAPDTVKAMLMALLCRMKIRSGRVDISLSLDPG
jgi:hypothetical protein